MMRDSEVFAFACPTIIFFTVPFLFGAYVRFLRYRETVVLAERGLLRERRNGNGYSGRGTFRWGILLVAIGSALCLGLWPIGFMVGGTPLGLGPWLLPGLLAASIGVAFIVIHYLGGDNDRYQPAEPDDIPPGKG